jgi:hypothetical protein
MRLTPALVSRVPPHTGDSGGLADRCDLHTDDDIAQTAATPLADRPPDGEVLILAYADLGTRV